MRLWKRITIYIVALVLAVSCLVSPAAAASVGSGNIVNMLSESNAYTFSVIDGERFDYIENYGFATNLKAGGISWFLGDVTYIEKFSFVIEADRAPDTIQVVTNRFTFNAVYDGSVGINHYYSVTVNEYVNDIKLNLYYVNAYTGQILLVSAFGLKNDDYSVTSATLVNQRLVYFPDTDEMTRLPFETVHKTLPFSSVTKSEFVTQLVDPLLGGYFFLRFEGSVLPFNYADSVTYVLATCGSADYAADSAHFACVLLDSSGNAITTLPVTYYPSGTFEGTGKYFGDEGMKWPLYLYTVVADTSGYDLSDKMISLQYQVDPVYVEAVEGYTGYMSEIRAIAVSPTIESVPWYARFGKWLTDGFNSVVSGLQTGFNNVVGNLQSGFKSVTDALSSIFNSEESQQLEQSSEEMKQSASDIGSASDSLGSVAQPDIDTGDLIGNYTNFEYGGLQVLACITSNSQVTSMMVVVFTFCLAGYIFFGKKG